MSVVVLPLTDVAQLLVVPVTSVAEPWVRVTTADRRVHFNSPLLRRQTGVRSTGRGALANRDGMSRTTLRRDNYYNDGASAVTAAAVDYYTVRGCVWPRRRESCCR